MRNFEIVAPIHMRPLRGRTEIHALVLPTFDPSGAGGSLWTERILKRKNAGTQPGIFLLRRMAKSPKHTQRQFQSRCRI
jgi:hypothetical protein